MSRITRTQPAVSHTASVAAETPQSHAAHDGQPGATGSQHAGQRPPAGRPTPRRPPAGSLAARRAFARVSAKRLAASRRKRKGGARGVSDDDEDFGDVDEGAGSSAGARVETLGDQQGDGRGGQDGREQHSHEHEGSSGKRARGADSSWRTAGGGAYANRRFIVGALAVFAEHPGDAAAKLLQLRLDWLHAGGVPSSGGLKQVAQQLAAYRPAPPAVREQDADADAVAGMLGREQRLNVLAPLVLLHAQRRYTEDGCDVAIATLTALLKAGELARRRAAEPSS